MALIVNIDVPDLAAATQFYCDGLGFKPVRHLFNGAVAELDLAGTRVFLIQADAGTVAVKGTNIQRDYTDHWSPVHLDVAVANIEAATTRAVAAGARPKGSISNHTFGRLAAFRDPFGHGVCLIEFSAAGYDAVADEVAHS